MLGVACVNCRVFTEVRPIEMGTKFGVRRLDCALYNLDSTVKRSESTEWSAAVDELHIPLRTHWVKDAPSDIGIGIGSDIGNRFSMYDSDSDSEVCAYLESEG